MAAPLLAHGKLQSHSSKHPNSKEEHGEGEKKIANSPKRRKKGANPPVSFDGLRPNTPRVPSFEARFHRTKLGFLDGKRG
jgi:hypothetical protein